MKIQPYKPKILFRNLKVGDILSMMLWNGIMGRVKITKISKKREEIYVKIINKQDNNRIGWISKLVLETLANED